MNVDVAALIRHCGTVTVPDGLDRVPMKVLGWQRQFIKGAFSQDGDACLSISRGAGKTTLAASLADAVLCGPLKAAGAECVIVSSSFNQSLIAFRQLLAGRSWSKSDFRVQNSPAVAAITCRHSGAMVRVIGSDPARAHGLIPTLIVADEPAQWPPSSADRMIAALRTSLGKRPGSRLLAIGTRPAGGESSENWFARMLAGEASGYTQSHAADPDDDPADEAVWHKANPSLKHFPHLLARMRREVKDALRSPQLMASFKALRLNMGTDDTIVDSLLTAGVWQDAEGDAPADGPFVLGVDLGMTVAMSAAAAYWPETGRLDAFAVFPAIPSLAEREKTDNTPYTAMEARGELLVRGDRVSDVGGLLEAVRQRWGVPAAVVADRWREGHLRQELEAIGFPAGPAFVSRGMGFFHGSRDVDRFRRAVVDGRVTPVKSLLLRSAMAEARVRTDDAGNQKISKKAKRAAGRDDAAVAAVLAVAEGVRSYRQADPVAEKVFVF